MKLKRFPAPLPQAFLALPPLIVTVYAGLFIFRIVEGTADKNERLRYKHYPIAIMPMAPSQFTALQQPHAVPVSGIFKIMI
ncbi:MAG: hypothetical protein JXA71_15645 [Chitinispirillaceae bacterium]|nr:hypothetical protein [Chitinispirillaceae bacterium]